MEAGRLNAYEAAPDAMRAVQRVEAYIQRQVPLGGRSDGSRLAAPELVALPPSGCTSAVVVCCI
jgi:hypothetical protein